MLSGITGGILDTITGTDGNEEDDDAKREEEF